MSGTPESARPADKPARTSRDQAAKLPRPTRFLSGPQLAFLVPVAVFSLGANLLMLGLPLFSMQIYDRVLPTRSEATLVVLTALIVGTILAVLLLDLVRGRLMVQLGAKLSARLSGPAIMAGLHGDGRSVATQPATDVETVRRVLSGPVALAVFDAPWSVLFILVMFSLHPYLGAIGLGGAAVLVLVAILTNARARRAANRVGLIERQTGSIVDEFGRENGALRAMGGVEEVQASVLAQRGRRLGLELQAGYASALGRSAGRAGRSALQLAVLGVAAWLAVLQEVPAGAIIAVSLLLGRALAPLEQLASGWHQLSEGRQAWRRLTTLERESAKPRRTRLPAVAGQLQAENISLRYGDRNAFVIRGLNLAVGAGETLAVVGPVGAGKSTLCRLLSGVEPPTTGELRLDGASLADWPPEQWGGSIGYVPQEFQLFQGTVAENIARFGEIDDAAVVAAAQLAGAHEQILSLPNAYETQLGETGTRLSSGERQMIGLARAFYGSPRFIVLDEPTFHLDDAGEQQLASALHELKATGCTIVLASRAASLLHLADHLLMLRRGRPPAFKANASIAELLRPRAVEQGAAPAGATRMGSR